MGCAGRPLGIGDAAVNYVAKDFGSDEAAAFQKNLPAANFVGFSDFFTLHLKNGDVADFWLGFGGQRSCKSSPCFSR